MIDRSSSETMAECLARRTKSSPADDAPPAWRGYIEARLEYAGCTNICQISRVGPIAWRGPSWARGFADDRRFAQPTPRAVTLMDEAFGWIYQCIPDVRLRHIVGRRTLVLPDSLAERPRYVWSWSSLVAEAGLSKTGPNLETMKRRWMVGVDMIVAQVTPQQERAPRRMPVRPAA